MGDIDINILWYYSEDSVIEHLFELLRKTSGQWRRFYLHFASSRIFGTSWQKLQAETLTLPRLVSFSVPMMSGDGSIGNGWSCPALHNVEIWMPGGTVFTSTRGFLSNVESLAIETPEHGMDPRTWIPILLDRSPRLRTLSLKGRRFTGNLQPFLPTTWSLSKTKDTPNPVPSIQKLSLNGTREFVLGALDVLSFHFVRELNISVNGELVFSDYSFPNLRKLSIFLDGRALLGSGDGSGPVFAPHLEELSVSGSWVDIKHPGPEGITFANLRKITFFEGSTAGLEHLDILKGLHLPGLQLLDISTCRGIQNKKLHWTDPLPALTKVLPFITEFRASAPKQGTAFVAFAKQMTCLEKLSLELREYSSLKVLDVFVYHRKETLLRSFSELEIIAVHLNEDVRSKITAALMKVMRDRAKMEVPLKKLRLVNFLEASIPAGLRSAGTTLEITEPFS
jgi:hypothetical protein